MALARFLVLDVCAGVWTCPHAVVGKRDERASDCSSSASSSSRYHGKWRESQLLLGPSPSARLLLLSVSVANRGSEISFSLVVLCVPDHPPRPSQSAGYLSGSLLVHVPLAVTSKYKRRVGPAQLDTRDWAGLKGHWD